MIIQLQKKFSLLTRNLFQNQILMFSMSWCIIIKKHKNQKS